MITGDVAAAAIPAPTRISTTTTAFRMIRVMQLPSCEQMRRRFASCVPSGTHCKHYIQNVV